jgi:Protein of unknown function (DUF1254)
MACQAYLWALPLVSYAQCRTQHYEVFGATGSDLVHYVSYRDRLGLITANATTPYILNFFDLGETGPLVIELPPGPTAGGVSDFWQREFGVMGEMGADKGQGGKHLVIPPGGPVPEADGFLALHATGLNVMFGFRTLDPDPERAQALVDAVRIYPYAQREDPPPTRVISPDGRTWSGDQPRPGLLGAPARDLSARDRRRARSLLSGDAAPARDRAGQALRARRAPDRDPGRCRRGRRADGAGQHVRQALPRLALLARPPMGPRDRPRQQRAARPLLRRAARTRFLVLRGGQLLGGDEEPHSRTRPGLPGGLRRHGRRVARRRTSIPAA